ncbi:MAG: ECF transporter S component [Calditrichaeota bacterium]|nr:MAG: ECF transporter S component [Calditrichota bacterium]
MKTETLKLTIIANFIAVGVAIGYALAFLPNIEMVTMIIFIGGYLLGWRSGAFIGLATEFIYSNFNLYGPAPIHILVAQIFAMTTTGIVGGIAKNIGGVNLSSVASRIMFLVLGGAVTVFFDLVTTWADVFIIDAGMGFFMSRLIAGMPFFAVHIVSNAFIFFFLVHTLIQTLQKLPVFERIRNI